MTARALMSWSSGKDSALALHELRSRDDIEVTGLLTTVSAPFSRVAMHGVREELLALQADALGLPLWRVEIPWPCSNEEYEAAMATVLTRAVGEGITVMGFGDLFLDDIRRYREQRFAASGVKPLFPLWGRDTRALAQEMLDTGIRATIVCVDPSQLDPRFCGRELDAALLEELPARVDPCGENGEFHTFVWDGPGFASPLAIRTGETVERDGFFFTDLQPAEATAV